MKRLPLILIGVVVLIGIAIALTSTPQGGRFADAGSCSELTAMFEAESVGDANERRAVGDEYREKLDLLGC